MNAGVTVNLSSHSMKFLSRFFVVSVLVLLTLGDLRAQTQAAEEGTSSALIFTGLMTLLFVALVLFIIFVLDGDVEPLTRGLKTIYNSIAPKSAGAAVPLDESHDGITEMDNLIPPWFNYLFGGTIVFAVIYLLNYHIWQSSPLPLAEYAEEVAAADLSRRVRMASEGTINEDALNPLADEASIKSGQDRFLRNCVTCHGTRAEGIVGPNLTDQYWIHGGGIRDVYTTIKNGVPEKGMISWKLIFTPKEIQQIASYVLSLKDSNPPNAKKAEGNLYIEPKPQPKDSANVARRL
ncbi:MAG: c-type cytochrome [Ignavibacteriales bacterium]|nr:c-type cytochrome [Ignavibacteriales bacterium]